MAKRLTPPDTVRIRVTVVDPPRGVWLRVQRGRDALELPARAAPDQVSFDFELRLGQPLADGRPNFLGEFAQGPPRDRFVYVNSGVRAGQEGSRWDRRAKVKLGGIDAPLLQRLRAVPDGVLEARIAGTGGDGGPTCATVELLDGGWKLVRERTT